MGLYELDTWVRENVRTHTAARKVVLNITDAVM